MWWDGSPFPFTYLIPGPWLLHQLNEKACCCICFWILHGNRSKERNTNLPDSFKNFGLRRILIAASTDKVLPVLACIVLSQVDRSLVQWAMRQAKLVTVLSASSAPESASAQCLRALEWLLRWCSEWKLKEWLPDLWPAHYSVKNWIDLYIGGEKFKRGQLKSLKTLKTITDLRTYRSCQQSSYFREAPD